MRPICFYHGGCPDGMTAAWIVQRAIPDIELVPCVYGSTEPVPDCAGRDVVIVDYTFDNPTMIAIAQSAQSLVVLDHHETAIANCDGLAEHPRTTVVLDMHRSGASIAFDRFASEAFPSYSEHAEVGEFVEYIQRRDLWQFEPGDGTDEFTAAVTSYPYTVEAWDAMCALGVDQLIDDGSAINRYRQRLIESAVANARPVEILGHPTWAAACPYAYGSDVAGLLAALHPECEFGAYYVDGPATRSWGLRVRGEGTFNVAQFAQLLGGGGHPKASGFRAGYDTPEIIFQPKETNP